MDKVLTLKKTDAGLANETKKRPDTMTEAHLVPNICKPVLETISDLENGEDTDTRDRTLMKGFNREQLTKMLTLFEDWGVEGASEKSDDAESELLNIAKQVNLLIMGFATINKDNLRTDAPSLAPHPQVERVHTAEYTTLVNGNEQNRVLYARFNYKKPVTRVTPKEISITTDDPQRPFRYALAKPLSIGVPWAVLQNGHLDAAIDRHVRSRGRRDPHPTETKAEIFADVRPLMENAEIESETGHIELRVGKVTHRRFVESSTPGLHSIGLEAINDWENDGIYLVPYIAITDQDGEVHRFHGEAFKGTEIMDDAESDFATIDDIGNIIPEGD